jgi:endo-1,4-beta-xylanase
MTQAGRFILALALALVAPRAGFGQQAPVTVEAESGTVGADFIVGADGTITYIGTATTIGGDNPTAASRTARYTATFPAAGNYELYVRLRVGPTADPAPNDDSLYYGTGFGAKDPTIGGQWTTANNLWNIGFTTPNERVVGGGVATTGVWKWIKLSAHSDPEPSVAAFVVPAGALTQTFDIAGRENGLFIDKWAFGRQGVFYTVNDLDNGLPGSVVPPPPPYTPPGPPIATGQPKFLGGVSSATQNLNFSAYFNQVTPENGGKWGSAEPQNNTPNWGDLDTAYNRAVADHIPFRMHTLIWGNQQPAWIESLPVAQQRVEIEQWFANVAGRYPNIDFIDVVNEPLHDPPRGAGNGNYIDALGGNGATGWDWVLESFRLARQYFPHAKLGINEFSVTNSPTDMGRYMDIIRLLQAENLIDTVGVQGHAFSTRNQTRQQIQDALTRLGTLGLPIYVTELDIDGPSDDVQLADYQRIFPAFWEHPAVRGITLWGYRPGHWRSAQGAYIVLANGAERPAMPWLIEYVRTAVLPPWITANPAPLSATVGDSVSFACAGDGSPTLAYQWSRNGVAIAGNASATTPLLALNTITTADAGVYACTVSNAAGAATSAAAGLSVAKALAQVTLSGLVQTYDGTPRVVTGASVLPAGLAVAIAYNGSPTAPTLPGSYAVVGTIVDANYVGSAAGTLVVSAFYVSRHAPAINGRVEGSVQVLLPEDVTLNGSALLKGDLLVPGTPTVVANRRAGFLGTIDGSGGAAPDTHRVILNAGAGLNYVGRRVDAVDLPAVPTPPFPAGAVDVVVNNPSQVPVDFASLRNLTLNRGADSVAVPAGTYGTFVANGISRLVLGVAGATEPSVYNLQGLVLNTDSKLLIAGPVVLNVAGSVTVNGAAGDPEHVRWLALNVAAGGVTLNSRGQLAAMVVAPAGTVTLNTWTFGAIAADRLVVNASARLVPGQ